MRCTTTPALEHEDEEESEAEEGDDEEDHTDESDAEDEESELRLPENRGPPPGANAKDVGYEDAHSDTSSSDSEKEEEEELPEPWPSRHIDRSTNDLESMLGCVCEWSALSEAAAAVPAHSCGALTLLLLAAGALDMMWMSTACV